jgi:hypothetical protein
MKAHNGDAAEPVAAKTESTLLIFVGLTGVGKSTALAAVPDALLLPNRRALADTLVIPEAQRLEGEAPRPVRDRLERFRLTARYRREHPGGMAHALERFLAGPRHDAPAAPLLLFDNLRGEDEVGYAVHAFPSARFVALEAPAAVRVLRLPGRGDAFDRVDVGPAAHGALLARLQGIEGLARLTDLPGLAAAAAGLDPDAVETGARVVVEESLHYDPEAAWRRLEPLPERRRLQLDTGRLDPGGVASRLQAWL